MIVAVDTGGTKTLIASFSRDGRMLKSFKYETPKDKKIYVNTLREALESNFGHEHVLALVIALPSYMVDGIAVWAPNLGWENFNLKHELTGVLNRAPIFIENDAKLAGLAGVRKLSKVPVSAFCVAIGTGIGTAVIENGKIDAALKRSEGGRMLLEFDGVVQEWEKFASGRAIREAYGKYARDIKNKRTWYEVAKRISRGLLVSIPLIQPDVVLIGGSIGTYFDNYSEQLKGILKEHLPAHIPLPEIVQVADSEQAVTYGCYYYALDNLNS